MRFILFIVLPAILFCRCEEKVKPPVIKSLDSKVLPSQESWNSTVVFSDSGIVRARLHANHIAMFEDRRETFLDSNIQIDFYNTDRSHSSVLTAKRGRVDDATKNMEAFENVVVVSDSGTVVKTEYLLWDNATKKIRSDKFVTIKSPDEYIQGYGFESDQGLKNYVIFRMSGSAMVEQKGDTISKK